jgi:HlyD family secretion protein
LEHGNRPEEIAAGPREPGSPPKADARQRQAANTSAWCLAAKTHRIGRGASASRTSTAPRQSLDVAEAKVAVSQKALDLEVAGPRVEDIAQAKATVAAAQHAHAAYALRQQCWPTRKLLAPSAGTIRSRLMEPGEMASPQKPVFSLAIIDPKWVRAYVSEPDLGQVHPGDKASTSWWTVSPIGVSRVSSALSRRSRSSRQRPSKPRNCARAWCTRFASFVKDPTDDLRLGMPATVRFFEYMRQMLATRADE